MNRTPDPRALTVTDAAEALRVSRATIYRMVKDGRLNPMNLGVRCTRFSRREIARVLDGT